MGSVNAPSGTPSVLGKIAGIVGMAAAFFALNALSFDSEVDRKISHAAQLQAQHTAAILHNLALLSQRQVVDGLAAELRLEEFLQTWYATELRREIDPGRLYELQGQQTRSEQRRRRLYERYRQATERLEALQTGQVAAPTVPLGQTRPGPGPPGFSPGGRAVFQQGSLGL